MADSPSGEALFVPAEGGSAPGDEIWQPTDLCRGPWDPQACHGGAPAALLAREMERVPLPETPDGPRPSIEAASIPMRLARLTVELVRPVPIEPLRLDTRVLRPGRKVMVLESTIRTVCDEAVVAMARALRIRTTPPGAVDLDDVGPGGPSAQGVDETPPPIPAATDDVTHAMASYVAFHNRGTEHRFARGTYFEPGPAFDWIRLAFPVVPGETPSPWQRVAAASDFANGTASSVRFGDAMFINPDLTVHLWREPVGEWIGLESVMRTSGTGIGASDSTLWDTHGRIGHTNQSLLLDSL